MNSTVSRMSPLQLRSMFPSLYKRLGQSVVKLSYLFLSHVNPCAHFNQPRLYPLGMESTKYVAEDQLVYGLQPTSKRLVPIQQVAKHNFFKKTLLDCQNLLTSQIIFNVCLRKWMHPNNAMLWNQTTPI